MTDFAIANLPGPYGSLQRARLYAPDGSTVADLALAESPVGTFGGSATLSPTPADDLATPYEYAVKQVLAQTSGGYDASSTFTVSRGTYGYLVGGDWYADPGDAQPAAPCYLTVAEAGVVAAALPSSLLAAWSAASTADRLTALVQATADVDSSMRFQGRKYDLDQTLEFPRAAYETAGQIAGLVGANVIPRGLADTVWDWDEATQAAVVPLRVKQAVVHQANEVLAGTRAGRLDARHDGLTAQTTGGLSEAYGGGGLPGRGGGPSPLCRQAAQLLVPYRIRQGRVL